MTYKWEGKRGDVVTFTVDLEGVMRRLAHRALYARSGKATTFYGMIKGVVTHRNPENYCKCGARYGGHLQHGKPYCIRCKTARA